MSGVGIVKGVGAGAGASSVGRASGPFERSAASPSNVFTYERPAVTSLANDISLGRQVLRRDVNERIRSVIDWTEAGTIDVFCECSRVRCAELIHLPIDDFDEAVASGRYVVADGHE
jgi:hypothetical protein